MEITFKQVHTAKDLTISAIIILSGAGLCFFNVALGVTGIVFGVLSLLFYKTGYRLSGGDGPVLSKKAFDVARTCRQSIFDYLSGKDVEPQLIAPGTGGVVRIEVFYNAEEGLAYARLYDFSNYMYEEATDMVELRSPKADSLISKLV